MVRISARSLSISFRKNKSIQLHDHFLRHRFIASSTESAGHLRHDTFPRFFRRAPPPKNALRKPRQSRMQVNRAFAVSQIQLYPTKLSWDAVRFEFFSPLSSRGIPTIFSFNSNSYGTAPVFCVKGFTIGTTCSA